jgi:hypothetical protein
VGVGVAAPDHSFQINGATATTLGVAIAPAGWNLRHRFSVPTAGSEAVISSNYNGSAVDDAAYATSSATFSPGLIRFGTGGANTAPTERLRITSDGKLGLGTSSPGNPLTVAMNGTTGPNGITGTNSVAAFLNAAADRGIAVNYDSANVTGGLFSVGADSKLCFYTPTGGAYAERLRIDNQGRVGIGTTSPTSPLTIATGSGAANGISLAGGSNVNDSQNLRFGFYFGGNYEPVSAITGVLTGGGPTQGALTFGTVTSGSLTEKARIDSSGRLLVGTSSALSNVYALTAALSPKLQIQASDNTAQASVIRTAGGGGSYFTLGWGSSGNVATTNQDLGVIQFNGFDGANYRNSASIICEADDAHASGDTPGRLVFSTTADGASSPTERMRITNSGTLYNNSESNGFHVATTQAAGTSTWLLRGRYGATATVPGSGTNCINIWSNGDVENTNNSYGAISDIKLKENIIDANSQWDDLKALQVRNYNFKEGQTHTQIGLIAQEVELVSPGLVTESPDRDEDGNDLGTVTKSVNYSVLYMKAVKALQEAMERIEVLEQRLTDAGIA